MKNKNQRTNPLSFGNLRTSPLTGRFNLGFTLVELLIVIALIAILSVAVLATINPIEQSNKARDAKFKNDAAEVLNAYERYYASQNNYPWNFKSTTNFAETPDFAVADQTFEVAFHSKDNRFGVLDSNGNVDTSQLISTSELKGAFGSKEPFVDNTSSGPGKLDAMYTYTGANSTYVCFCPKAKANRTGKVGESLKCLKNLSVKGDIALDDAKLQDAVITAGSECTIPTADEILKAEFCNIVNTNTYANLLCVPEGKVSGVAP